METSDLMWPQSVPFIKVIRGHYQDDLRHSLRSLQGDLHVPFIKMTLASSRWPDPDFIYQGEPCRLWTYTDIRQPPPLTTRDPLKFKKHEKRIRGDETLGCLSSEISGPPRQLPDTSPQSPECNTLSLEGFNAAAYSPQSPECRTLFLKGYQLFTPVPRMQNILLRAIPGTRPSRRNAGHYS